MDEMKKLVVSYFVIPVLVGFLCLVYAFHGTASAPAPSITLTQVTPAPEPTPVPVLSPDFKICPYCHFILPGKDSPDGKSFSFTNHRMINLPISETMVFETCERNYFTHLGPVMLDLQRNGMGKTIEAPPPEDEKAPATSPKTRTKI